MKPWRTLVGFAVGAAGYIIYAYGLWEPLRTIVIGSLCASVALAALLRHRQRSEPTDAGYLQIALGAIAVGAGATAVAAPRFVGIAPAEILAPLLTMTAVGSVGAAFALSTRSRKLGRTADIEDPAPVLQLPSREP